MKLSLSGVYTSATRLMLFSEIICRIYSFAVGIIILLFDKNCHILILTKKEPFISKDTSYFTLPYFIFFFTNAISFSNAIRRI